MSNLAQHPRYIRIAIDIANRIITEELKEKQKIKGRSTLAGEYNVSPETIRRSMALLSDLEVVEVLPNSGIIIKSKEKAHDFISKFSSKENISTLRINIKNLIEERNKINDEIEMDLDLILEQFSKIKSARLIQHHKIKIQDGSFVIGKTISELKFWNNTGATILGIQRGNELLVSPGPYFAFEKEDLIIFVGAEDVDLRVAKFIETIQV